MFHCLIPDILTIVPIAIRIGDFLMFESKANFKKPGKYPVIKSLGNGLNCANLISNCITL